MKKKQNEFLDYVASVCRVLRAEFFMQEWTIFYEESEGRKLEQNEFAIAAEVVIEDVYRHVLVKTHPMLKSMWEDGDHVDITKTLIHEFCHVLTEPLYIMAINSVNNQTREFLEEKRERQTERIAIIIRSLLGKDFYDQFKIKHAKDEKGKRKQKIKTASKGNKGEGGKD